MEIDTFGVISSTNPKFTEAVHRVPPDWAYAPAMLNGKRVRQLVQQPFNFVVDSSVVARNGTIGISRFGFSRSQEPWFQGL